MRTGSTKTSGQRKVLSVSGLDCAAAFKRIARDCVAGVKSHHSSACAGDVEAVHQIRVAITRLRAVVSFFAQIAVDEEWLRLKQEIAWLNPSLGAARDNDVVAEYAGRKRYQAWARRTIGSDLDQRRTQDHRRLVRCLRSVRFQRLIEALSGWLKQGPWLVRWEQAARGGTAEPLERYCERELNRWCERLIRKGWHLATLNASRRHRLRIKAKRFRYMLEALTDIVMVRGSGEFCHLHRLAKRLQRALGDLRDLKRLAEVGATENGNRGRRRPPGYRRQREKLLMAAIEAHRSFRQVGARGRLRLA